MLEKIFFSFLFFACSSGSLFHADFVSDNLKQSFNSPPWFEGVERTERVFDKEKKKTVLRVHYPKGEFGNVKGGAQWIAYLGQSFNDLKLSYWLRFSENFDCRRGGKLPGLIGGHLQDRINSTVTGGHRPSGDDGWSARIMWRADCHLVQYIYHKNQPSNYGQDFSWKKNGVKVKIILGQWHQVTTRIVMNQVGLKNGIVQSWLDGDLVLEQRDLEFRTISTLGIDALYFSTFFGGDDQSWAPVRDSFADFDDFTIVH